MKRYVLYSLVDTLKVKKIPGGPKCRGKNDIASDVRQIRCKGRNYVKMAQDRVRWRELFLISVFHSTIKLRDEFGIC